MRTRIITLSNAPPVRISEADWPLIASVTNRFEHNGTDCSCFIGVRQNRNDNCLVYGAITKLYRDYSETVYRAGYLVDCYDDVVDAIREISGELQHLAGKSPHINATASDCIADLPPTVLV
jgi:hypothetical protein